MEKPKWDGSVDRRWGGEFRRFRLGLLETRKVQEETLRGPHVLLRRLQSGDWEVDEARSVLRYGLEGGGMSPNKAMDLIERYFDNRPWAESVPIALDVLAHSIFLMEDPGDEPGKPEGSEGTPEG